MFSAYQNVREEAEKKGAVFCDRQRLVREMRIPVVMESAGKTVESEVSHAAMLTYLLIHPTRMRPPLEKQRGKELSFG